MGKENEGEERGKRVRGEGRTFYPLKNIFDSVSLFFNLTEEKVNTKKEGYKGRKKKEKKKRKKKEKKKWCVCGPNLISNQD